MEDVVQIPVEYVITTTSDWTKFEIIEGGEWRDIYIELLEGSDVAALSQEIFYNRKTIWIKKFSMDRRRIRIGVTCVLNIPKEYLNSDIVYKITKGDIEATVVDVFINGEILFNFVNATNIQNDPYNPLTFVTVAQDYLPDDEKKEKTIKESEKKEANQKKEAIAEQENFIVQTFNAKFKEIFEKKEPTENDVKEIFEWIGTQGENATKLLEADICRKLALHTEVRFRRNLNLNKKVAEESKKAGKKIKKRYDELRKIEGKISLSTQYLGIEKEEKKIAPEK